MPCMGCEGGEEGRSKGLREKEGGRKIWMDSRGSGEKGGGERREGETEMGGVKKRMSGTGSGVKRGGRV